MKRFPALPLLLCAFAAAAFCAEPAAEDTVITSEHMDTRAIGQETYTVLWGNVVVTGTNLRIACDRLEVVALRPDDQTQLVAKKNRFKSLVAAGHVSILQKDSNREATCGRAVVLPGDDKITLTEAPKVVDRGPNGQVEWTWTGDELELLRGENQIHGTNIRVTGPPIQNLGFDKSKATRPAEADAPPAR